MEFVPHSYGIACPRNWNKTTEHCVWVSLGSLGKANYAEAMQGKDLASRCLSGMCHLYYAITAGMCPFTHCR